MTMTREKAIKILKRELEPEDGKWHPFEEVKEALDMAIEALKTDLVRCNDCKHRETDDCPMYWMEWLMFKDCDGYTDNNYIVHDYTTDDGYCNYGERKSGDIE